MNGFETTKRNAARNTRSSESPEITGDYRCPHCGNTERFIGYDDHGFPGDDCDCGKEICECQVTLRQPFRVNARGEVTYAAFTGGGNDAEIGTYDRIDCDCCRAQTWPAGGSANR